MFEAFMQPVWQRVAESLLHFVWQGTVIAVLLAAILRLGRFRAANTRYAVTLAALSLMAICPIATFCLIPPPAAPRAVAEIADAETVVPAEANIAEASGRPFPPAAAPAESSASGRPPETAAPATAEPTWRTAYGRFAPYIVGIWLLGGGLFAVRLLLGAGALGWMTRRRAPVPGAVENLIGDLCRRMNLRRRPRVFACERCPEAMAFGWLKPVVLIPASWLVKIQPDVLEAVFAHELAHIRRRDMWVNLAQRIMETLLFYHPAVWWVSNRLRIEREYCCDDLAVAATGRRAGYAEALEWVARIGADRKSPVLAMTIGGKKMALLNRVRHVLRTPAAPRQGGWLAAGFATLLIPVLLWGVLLGWNPLSADGAPAIQREGEEKERGERQRGERERGERGEREERERGERERNERRERGERERRERGEREERERGERREREGDRRERGERRERENDRRERGERREREGDRREGERRREGDRPRGELRRRDGGPEKKRPRFDRRGPGGELREVMNALRELREEVARLRREVNELRGRRGGPVPRFRRDDDRRPFRRPDIRKDGDRKRPERDRPERDRPRDESKREGDKRDRPEKPETVKE